MLTGKPWKRPAARFAAPIPIISWLPSISSPERAANAVEVEIVSVKDTTAMPSAPANISPRSAKSTWGMVNGGKPSREFPDQRDALGCQVEDRRGRDRERPP